MGSFNISCAFSGLPIAPGDSVRFFLLTKSPYEDEPHYVHGLWFPRTWPLRAEYADYGMVDHIECAVGKKAWMDAFKLDLVERGWGDNSAHDVPTNKNMTFDEMLDAIRERRVLVKSNVEYGVLSGTAATLEKMKKLHKKLKNKELSDAVAMLEEHAQEDAKDLIAEVPAGVPMRHEIDKLLASRGFIGDKAVLVDDDDGYGRIRVRLAGYGNDKTTALQQAEKIIKNAGYATMLTSGTGSYAHAAELLVRPKPEVEGYRFPATYNDNHSPLLVQMAVVREDVWKALCDISRKEEYSSMATLTAADFRAGARQAWKQNAGNAADGMLAEMALRENVTTQAFAHSAVPFTVGLSTSFRLMAQRAKAMSAKAASNFLDDAGDFAYLQYLLSRTNYKFAPSYYAGQVENWRLHEEIIKSIGSVTEACATADEIERKKWE